MDMFTGADRSIPNSEVFPQHITPFPEAADFLFSNPTAVIRSADTEFIDRRPTLAAQKLRPIRCNGGRSPATEAPVTRGVAGTLECCDDVVSPEMGFLGRQDICGFSFDSQAKGGYGALADNGGGGGNGSVMGTGLDSLNPNLFDEEESSSSSSEDDNDSSLADNKRGPLNRKRKRKSKSTTKVMMLFLENLTMKVMERQEEMHRQLIEMIEMRERERINREEAWKQQEMERMKRDEQQRAQEKSRSLALISLIQNLLGDEVEIPKSLATLPMEEEDAGEVHLQTTDIKCECEPNNRRWPEAEVGALITVRSGLEQKFRMMSPKGSVWEEISVEMRKMGYNRSAKKCKEKWENINKYFKRSMESGKKRPENIKTCSYFHELDILYKSGLVSSGNASHNTEHENAASSENPSLNN